MPNSHPSKILGLVILCRLLWALLFLAILVDSFVWGSAGVRKNLSIGVVINKYREEACLPKPTYTVDSTRVLS
jgi:hypothetical protein